MGLITDKIALGYDALTNYTLDVSGDTKIESLAGPDVRLVLVDANGLMTSTSLPGSTGLIGLFGDGSDGNVTISSSTNLTKEMHYENLTISGAGTKLHTSGYIIRVKGTLSMTGGCYITCDGSNGVASTSATGGDGGSGAYTAARYPWQQVPGNGGHGWTITISAVTNNNGASRGVPFINSSTNVPFGYQVGCGGGGGGGHGSTTSDIPAVAGDNVWFGNAGGTGSASISGNNGQAGGGGGGGGGGSCIIYAYDISIDKGLVQNYLTAKGGDGGAGYSYVSGIGGGGGGGGGGSVVLTYKYNSQGKLPTISAAAGAVGANGTATTAATAGYANNFYKIWTPTITLSPNELTPATAPTTTQIDVTTDPSGYRWQVYTTDVSTWISFSGDVSGNGTGHFHITNNAPIQDRYAAIKVYSPSDNLVASLVTVTEEAI